MGDNQTLVARSKRRRNDRIIKGHDPIGSVLQGFCTTRFQLFCGEFPVSSVISMPIWVVIFHLRWSHVVGPSHLHYEFLIQSQVFVSFVFVVSLESTEQEGNEKKFVNTGCITSHHPPMSPPCSISIECSHAFPTSAWLSSFQILKHTPRQLQSEKKI